MPPHRSNFWIFGVLILSSIGLAMSLFRGHDEMAAVFGCLYLIASGIDRQVGIDREERKL